jgi:hypothetical protein
MAKVDGIASKDFSIVSENPTELLNRTATVICEKALVLTQVDVRSKSRI